MKRILANRKENVVLIEDIKDSDTLFNQYFDGYRLYDSAFCEVFEWNKFFGFITKAILECDTIMEFERRSNLITIKYVEKCDGLLHEVQEVFEYQSEDKKFLKTIDKCILLYRLFRGKTIKNFIKKKEVEQQNDEIFRESLRLLRMYARGKVKKNCDKMLACKMYIFIYENQKNAKYFAVYSDEHLRKNHCLVMLLAAIVFWGLSLLLMCSIQIIPAIIAASIGIAFSYVAKTIKNSSGKKDIFQYALEELGSEYGIDYESALKYLNDKTIESRDFIDFLEDDIEYMKEMGESELNIAEFESLRKEFALAKMSECQSERGIFLSRLADLEIKMYSINAQVGSKRIACGINHVNFLEKLQYIGWSEEQTERDKFLKSIIDIVHEIDSLTCTGCEVEQALLLKLAVVYCQEACSDTDHEIKRLAAYENIKKQIADLINYKKGTVLELEKYDQKLLSGEKLCIEASIRDKVIALACNSIR